MTRSLFLAIAVATALWALAPALAGQLGPPPGPIAPTMKPLDIVEPRTPISQATTPGDAQHTFIISAPGSYYLTQDVQCLPGVSGIRITANDVTIDLSGFTLRGDSTGGSNTGIVTSDFRRACAIRNGVITGFAYASLQGRFEQTIFENLHVYGNNAGGLETANLEHCIFRNMTIETVAEIGLNAGNHAIVENCVLTGGFAGLITGFGTRVSGCTISGAGTGIELISGSVTNCVIEGCEVGIHAWAGSVQGCTIANATASGIDFRSGVSIRSNTFTACAVGARNEVAAFGRSLIDTNTFSDCAAGVVLTQPGSTVTRNMFIHTAGAPITAVAGNNAAPVVASPAGAGPWDNIAF